MFQIDLPTMYLNYILVIVINLILSSFLYFQIKKRFPGTLLIVLSIYMSSTGNILVFLRNKIPDWISIPIANILVISAIVILLIGLEKFVNKKGSQIHNYILLFVFFIIHTYFTYVVPDLKARHLNLSFAFMILSFQLAYLMLKRTSVVMRKITNPVGYVFSMIFIFHVFRITYLIQSKQALSNSIESNSIESLFLLSWELIIILLLCSLFLMYNKRLIIDINTQEEKFSKAFHEAPFMIMISKLSDGNIFEVNKKMETISGYLPSELIGKTTVDLKIWGDPNERLDFVSTLKSEGAIIEKEYTIRKKSGELFPGMVSAKIVYINQEQCIISVIDDITIRKKSEKNLRKKEAKLRKLNSTKDKFFTIIAHDLKSPFNGILGFSEILSEQVKNNNYEGIDKYAEIINTSSQHAVNLLSNLMEWSMSQTGRMRFNPEYVDLIYMIKSTLVLLKPSSDQKLINIHLNAPNNIILYVDKVMIEVVIRNLISNAIKFTPREGTITIHTEDKGNNYLFTFEDNGVGIQSNHIENLFKIDNTFSTLGTNNERGTGLGLILCRDFINYHKGKIGVESELGIGSKFYFYIPKTYPPLSL